MFDLSDIVRENRRKFLARLKKSDPVHAARFCHDCTQYVGSAGTCSCKSES